MRSGVPPDAGKAQESLLEAVVVILEAWMSEMDKREAEQDAVLDEIIEAMEQGR